MSTPAVNHPKKVKTRGPCTTGPTACTLVITTAIFPIFYNALTSERNEAGEIVNDVVTFFGAEFINTQLYSYVLAASFIVVIIASPLLSGMAMCPARSCS